MYVGHVGIALGLRRLPSAPSLWLLVVASQLPDWGDALLQLAGTRASVPGWSPHGWPLVGIGALGVAVIGARSTGAWRAGALAALACVSHWVADYFTGWKPTWPGGPTDVGLGWYGHPPRDFLFEAVITIGGWMLWRASLPRPAVASSARARGPTSSRPAIAWALLGALLAMQLAVDVVMARNGVGHP